VQIAGETAVSDKLKVQGYVYDNMEGALDQAAFLAQVDIPVAVIGPRGTGKFYVANTIHRESGGLADGIVVIDCREFRNREEASAHIKKVLASAAGKTLVFKSPHLMNIQAQLKLARQLSSRRLEGSPATALPQAKFVALFPESLEQLIRSGELASELASAFGGYPIHVPPIRFRKRAILRWAYKILGQESVDRQRSVKGFTPDAEEAMLHHEWHGNLTEMRQRIIAALLHSDEQWISPLELDLLKDSKDSLSTSPSSLNPYLDTLSKVDEAEEAFSPSALDELKLALAQAVSKALVDQDALPLGTWLWDEVVLAVISRYADQLPRAGEFLHTTSRNLSRWLPGIEQRLAQRNLSSYWRESQRLVAPWVRELPVSEEPLKETVLNMLMFQLEHQGKQAVLPLRAHILGVSAPTYQKRLKDYTQRLAAEPDSMDGTI
jgi:transcriptional regulator with AAA-type ATPase domain